MAKLYLAAGEFLLVDHVLNTSQSNNRNSVDWLEISLAQFSQHEGIPEPKNIQFLKPLSRKIQICFSGAGTIPVQVSAVVQNIGVS